MNKWLKRFFIVPAFFVGCLLVFAFLINLALPRADSYLTVSDLKHRSKISAFKYVALGDSLTQGVGDTTNQGGFVPILSRQVESDYHYRVTAKNYGVAGNTSQQILTRMKEKTDLQDDLKKADLLTLTVGGNDVMAVLRKNLANLTVDSFTKPSEEYQQRLRKIIALARKDNKDMPIYILGIYNPFYLNFPDMTQMQDIVDNWNKGTKAVADEYDKVYFVEINDRLYKGIDGKEGVAESGDTSDTSNKKNDVLFEKDHFHPNNTGYQIMANAVLEKINATKKDW
ncbi:SGNH/GDSL hydrolase family protein [Streptococcus sobrinus]|uniref:SGNH/GDSL hydrolase family protein n=1 Tax=Streptococcus sobrinus TaxID=1310 RepID=UPI000D7082C9|nr:SGNH/GDSL hydrolase family protein [Streptococcus sobrinus]AWN61282.1 GDSL family lipase [Streptococcus sobrinus]AWN63155.1 GDSL family lipase [Streptococcus sobrinus]SQG19389.1 GDSL-like Lipase/Acylhydrolase [Streptococcus sobrinus]